MVKYETYIFEYEKNEKIRWLAEVIAEQRQEIEKLRTELRQAESELAERVEVSI